MQLFPNIQDLSLNKLLGRLRDRSHTPRIPVRRPPAACLYAKEVGSLN